MTATDAGGRAVVWRVALIAAATLVAYAPVLRNGFLVIGFDDNGFIHDNPYLRPSWVNARAVLTGFYLYDYLPVPLLAHMLEFRVFGLEPVGYHAVNLLLHVVNAVLVFVVARRALGDDAGALAAAVVFGVHPVQLEAVSLVAQLKTLLATGFLLGALTAYQCFRDGRRLALAVAVVLYALACGSKSSVVPFPLLLILYDDVWGHDRRTWLDKLPFVLLALAAAWASAAAKVGGEVIKTPHGGSYLATALVMSRVMWEYGAAMFVPIDLAPAYYYRREAVFSAASWAAAAGLVALAVVVCRQRRQWPITYFAAGWMALTLLPVANLVPLSVLRADRFLYLPMVGFAVWAGVGLAAAARRAATLAAVPRAAVRALVSAPLVLWALGTWFYAEVWHDDVRAFTRVVQRQPWSAKGRYLLALAYRQEGATDAARREAATAVSLDPRLEEARVLLAELEDGSGSSDARRP